MLSVPGRINSLAGKRTNWRGIGSEGIEEAEEERKNKIKKTAGSRLLWEHAVLSSHMTSVFLLSSSWG